MNKEEVSGHPATWQEFTEFLLTQLDSIDRIREDAEQAYGDARQRASQSIRDFSAYLSEKLAHFREQPTEVQKITDLRVKTLAEIRQEIPRYNRKCTTYDEFVEYLQEIEYNLESRRQALDKAKRSKQGKGKTPERSSDSRSSNDRNAIRAPRRDHGPGTEQQKKRRGNYSVECFYCHKPGHMEFEWRKKQADTEKKKRGESEKQGSEQKKN